MSEPLDPIFAVVSFSFLSQWRRAHSRDLINFAGWHRHSFTFIKRLFSSSSLSAIRVVSSAYLRLLRCLPAILIPACASSSPAFLMMYSAYKLNKQGDNIHPWQTPFPIWNQSVVPCPVLIWSHKTRVLKVWSLDHLHQHHQGSLIKSTKRYGIWEFAFLISREDITLGSHTSLYF